MKLSVIKIISVLSFLMICSVDRDDLPVFIYIIFGLFQFINDIVSLSFSQHTILWEGIAMIPLIGTLYIFASSGKFKDRYLMLFCFIALLSILFSLIVPSIFYKDNISKLRLSFIIPFIIFVIGSIYTLLLVFKNNKE
ncbi:hypothetical protein CQ046_18780 [Chryseobacterium sp. MYb7]|nr:hypothetical protein CQ046_18780 [Chryseobacterium sp. MYb7]